MATPSEILNVAFGHAIGQLDKPIVMSEVIGNRVEVVCRSWNRSGSRLLLATLLAKIDRPHVDIRKPYTELGGDDSYAGRTYDQDYVQPFVDDYDLPCNPTTAFLTPAFRTKNTILTPSLKMSGRPKEMYDATLQLLSDVQDGRVAAQDLLIEVIRQLIILKNERDQELDALKEEARLGDEAIPLSVEDMVRLIQQHLNSPNSARLPVLVVAAAYKSAEARLGERVLSLQRHNAADKQTGALGDLEITLIDDENIVTSYEMKTRKVTKDDIYQALRKMRLSGVRLDNYIFITTDVIPDEIRDYAAGMYQKTGGVEVAILDCISFLRHFLHLFHRLRMQFLDEYEKLVLDEPDSAVRHELKRSFLALRLAAQSGIQAAISDDEIQEG